MPTVKGVMHSRRRCFGGAAAVHQSHQSRRAGHHDPRNDRIFPFCASLLSVPSVIAPGARAVQAETDTARDRDRFEPMRCLFPHADVHAHMLGRWPTVTAIIQPDGQGAAA